MAFPAVNMKILAWGIRFSAQNWAFSTSRRSKLGNSSPQSFRQKIADMFFRLSLFFIGFSIIFALSAFCNNEAILNQFGSNYGPLRDNLDSLWTVLSLTSPIFEPTWIHLMPLWRALGLPWSHFGVNLGHLETMVAPTWAILLPTWTLSTHLGAYLSRIATNLDELGDRMALT